MAKLGQHFLKNKIKLKKIVNSLELKDDDVVVEIGPGHGELTSGIMNHELGIRMIVIEKDKSLVQLLQKKFSKNKNIEIIQGDALKILPSIIPDSKFLIQNYKLVGNIPYYITGYLFRILGELENKPSLIVLLIQKEVAERICAKQPKMNLLAAAVQFWAEPKIIGYVSREDFKPAPKVDSAIIKLSPKCSFSHSQECWNKQNMEDYYKFIKILFKQPRKTIINNLVVSSKYKVAKENKEEIIERLRELGVEPQARPQDLSVEEIKKLSKNLPHWA